MSKVYSIVSDLDLCASVRLILIFIVTAGCALLPLHDATPVIERLLQLVGPPLQRLDEFGPWSRN